MHSLGPKEPTTCTLSYHHCESWACPTQQRYCFGSGVAGRIGKALHSKAWATKTESVIKSENPWRVTSCPLFKTNRWNMEGNSQSSQQFAYPDLCWWVHCTGVRARETKWGNITYYCAPCSMLSIMVKFSASQQFVNPSLVRYMT